MQRKSKLRTRNHQFLEQCLQICRKQQIEYVILWLTEKSINAGKIQTENRKLSISRTMTSDLQETAKRIGNSLATFVIFVEKTHIA